MHSAKRMKVRLRTNLPQYVRCMAKAATFAVWAGLYVVVMRLTILKPSVEPQKDWLPENYTKWLEPVLVDDDSDLDENHQWLEPDNATIQELDRRASKVQEACLKQGLTQNVNSKEFFVDHTHNLVWCNVFKAASSYWLYKFNILGGYDEKYLKRTRFTPLELARKKFPRPSEEVLKEAISSPGVISLMVVREPFVRLLSAYRDKLEGVLPQFYRKLARKIILEHREKATKVIGPIKRYHPTFYEFVSYLIDTHKKNLTEFDEHWAPYYQFCTPCAVNFSVIAKVETLDRDTNYVIQQLGLGQLLERRIKDKKTRIRTVMNRSRDGRKTTALLKHYFSQISEEMLHELLNIYGLDFDMFGYDANVYKSYVRKK